jgi:hypothetical protein
MGMDMDMEMISASEAPLVSTLCVCSVDGVITLTRLPAKATQAAKPKNEVKSSESDVWCQGCGYVHPSKFVENLAEAEWVCSECATVHPDRLWREGYDDMERCDGFEGTIDDRARAQDAKDMLGTRVGQGRGARGLQRTSQKVWSAEVSKRDVRIKADAQQITDVLVDIMGIRDTGACERAMQLYQAYRSAAKNQCREGGLCGKRNLQAACAWLALSSSPVLHMRMDTFLARFSGSEDRAQVAAFVSRTCEVMTHIQKRVPLRLVKHVIDKRSVSHDLVITCRDTVRSCCDKGIMPRELQRVVTNAAEDLVGLLSRALLLKTPKSLSQAIAYEAYVRTVAVVLEVETDAGQDAEADAELRKSAGSTATAAEYLAQLEGKTMTQSNAKLKTLLRLLEGIRGDSGVKDGEAALASNIRKGLRVRMAAMAATPKIK